MEIFFPKGLPGFENYKKYNLQEEPDTPMANLHSLEEENVGFLLLKPHTHFRDYPVKIKINQEESKTLEVTPEDQVDIWVLLTLSQSDLTKTTANLRAPIIINTRQQKGIQLILDEETYSYRQPLFSAAGNSLVTVENTPLEGGRADVSSNQED